MKREHIRRIFAILAFLVMMITACALAEEPAPTEVSAWASLQAAFHHGGRFKLTASVSPGESDGLLTVPENADIVPEDVQTAYAGYIQQMMDGVFMGGGE